MNRRRARPAPTPGQVALVIGAAIALPALVGGIVSVTGHGSFWHGVVVMALFNVVLLVVLAAVVVALARRESLGPR